MLAELFRREDLLLALVHLVLQITYLVKLLPVLELHGLVLALSQLEVVLADFQVGFRLTESLGLGIKLDKKLVAVFGQRGQPIDLVLQPLDLLGVSLAPRVHLLLLELSAQFAILFLALLELLLGHLELDAQLVVLVRALDQLLVELLHQPVVDGAGAVHALCGG